MTCDPLTPGSALAVVGGGQLGRMFAMAAARLGYRVVVLAPEEDPPAAQVAAEHVRADYLDENALLRIADKAQAVTYEFENIPPKALEFLAERTRVCPAPWILAATRQRISEKEFLQKHGIPVTPFRRARSPEDVELTMQKDFDDIIVKTAEWGYDGKGQMAMRAGESAQAVWAELGHPAECIVEKRVDLAEEFSVLVARDVRGHTVFYGPFHNTHCNHILDLTWWRAEETGPIASAAREIAAAVADAFDLVGLICIECFVASDGAIMVNEIAPRPHNSGHLTIEAMTVSQFEQQVRLTAGGTAVEPVARAPAAAMANLLGDLWLRAGGQPKWEKVLNDPRVTLHLYGKHEARPGRKMGHLTALAATSEEARETVLRARESLVSFA